MLRELGQLVIMQHYGKFRSMDVNEHACKTETLW